MQKVNVAITGAGSVGRLLAETIIKNQNFYRERFSKEVSVVAMCNSKAGFAAGTGSATAWQQGLTGITFAENLFASAHTSDPQNETQVNVLFEASPSNYDSGEPGLSYTTMALQAGAHVVSVSKGALVTNGEALQKLAHANKAQLLASAAGSAGLPLIDLLKTNALGNRTKQIDAILTGTTAFILDQMINNNVAYSEALAAAQQLGISETDPSFDVDGWDTAAKLVIIAGMAFGVWIDLDQIPKDSLRSISVEQIARCKSENLRPALVGSLVIDAENPEASSAEGSEERGLGITASVELREFEADHTYHSVSGSVKSAFIDTELGSYSLIGGSSDLSVTVAAALKDFEKILDSIPLHS